MCRLALFLANTNIVSRSRNSKDRHEFGGEHGEGALLCRTTGIQTTQIAGETERQPNAKVPWPYFPFEFPVPEKPQDNRAPPSCSNLQRGDLKNRDPYHRYSHCLIGFPPAVTTARLNTKATNLNRDTTNHEFVLVREG